VDEEKNELVAHMAEIEKKQREERAESPDGKTTFERRMTRTKPRGGRKRGGRNVDLDHQPMTI